MPGPEDALQAELQALLRLVESLTGQFDEVVAASRDSNADDEHDPEGATIGFERAQLSALLIAAHRRRVDVEAGLTAVRHGGYGVCAGCGEPVGAERLAARPSARTCIACAARRR